MPVVVEIDAHRTPTRGYTTNARNLVFSLFLIDFAAVDVLNFNL